MNRPWVIMPVMVGPEMTIAALSDLLVQTMPCRILVVNQGVEDPFRDQLERIAEEHDQVMLWNHQPPLPSLSATWNRALDAAWEAGTVEALVVNNDVRLHRQTLEILSTVRTDTGASLVSAVGVTAEQFDPSVELVTAEVCGSSRGGPDFSCFLIARSCHQAYRFDEQFIPAHCEDLDYHRRLLLDGHGSRIFSVGLPYLHLGAQTIKLSSPAQRARIEHLTETVARAHYVKKWGGPVNHERYRVPFDADTDAEGVTTPELQAACAAASPS